MPIARFEMPDGRVARFEVPEGTTPEQAQQMIQASMSSAAPKPATPTAPAGEPMSRLDKIMKGVRDPIDGGAQLLTNALPKGFVQAGDKFNNWLADTTGLVGRLPEGGVDQQVRQDEAAYQAKRKAAGESGFDGYRTIGNVVSPANLAIPTGGAATTLGGRVLAGAASGSASAALAPVTEGDYWQGKRAQIGTGAAAGGAMPLVTGAVSRLVSPKASTNPQLQMLRKEGVQPTIGQTLGGRWNALEEKMQSLPIAGDFIANARTRSLEQFNNAAINRAAGKVGGAVEGTGQSAVREAGDLLSRSYDDALNQIKVVKFDPQFATDLTQLKGMGQSLVTGGMHGGPREKFEAVVKDVFEGRMSGGSMLGVTYKKVDSELGALAAKYQKSALASESELGDAFSQLQNLLKQQAMRSNPQAAQALKAADAGWANLVRVEQAAKVGKNAEGMFTPGQLNSAIQQADGSVRGRAVARGTALMQDLGNAGQQVIGNKVPNSFTTDRALIAGGGLGAGLLNPAIPAGLLGTGLMYTPAMQGLLSGAVSSRPESAKAIAEALRKASPRLAPAAAQIGIGLLR